MGTTRTAGSTTTRRTVANAARGLTAASVLLSAVVHLELWVQGMSVVPVIGPAFLVNAVGGLVIGVALVVWDHALPLLAAIVFGLTTLGAYVMSITVGLFGVQEQPGGAAATISAVSEVTAVVFAVVALLAERGLRRAAAATSPADPTRTLTPPRPGRP